MSDFEEVSNKVADLIIKLLNINLKLKELAEKSNQASRELCKLVGRVIRDADSRYQRGDVIKQLAEDSVLGIGYKILLCMDDNVYIRVRLEKPLSSDFYRFFKQVAGESLHTLLRFLAVVNSVNDVLSGIDDVRQKLNIIEDKVSLIRKIIEKIKEEVGDIKALA